MRACSVCGTLTANHPARGSAICSDGCRAVRKRANYRAKNYRRRTARRTLDVTQDHERELRRAAKRCPMPGCGVKLTDAPFLPHSKELDHIVPINAGGTHTIGNVRITCRRCNISRPDDGSDYTGPVTLWAEEPGIVLARQPRKPAPRCACGQRLTGGRCTRCSPLQVGRPAMVAEGQRAAELRALGWGWWAIATECGFGSAGAAHNSASKFGDPEHIDRWPRRAA